VRYTARLAGAGRRNAHTLRIDELARRMQALAAQAADGTISPDSLTGATFTISNLGALGIESFTPVINGRKWRSSASVPSS
jgi:pyruvate/2-oxoglutarate dehydrogenase complex dihydrolipoamide acyltransferase (E2) component